MYQNVYVLMIINILNLDKHSRIFECMKRFLKKARKAPQFSKS